jgi:hypothetical protein
LSRWRYRFSQLFNVHGINDVIQTEIHTAIQLGTQPSAFEFEVAIQKLKRLKSQGFDQIPAELIKSEGRTIRSEIQQLINSI